MTYDLAFRFRRALQPDGLATIPTATQAVVDALQDARNAGIDPERDPAILLLARHLGRIAMGQACDATFPEDRELRLQCFARIDELRGKPALIALARRGVAYDLEAKRAFHRESRAALQMAARQLGFLPDDYDLRNTMAGPAVSGEITLHADTLYIQVSISVMGQGREVLFRQCRGRRDYVGDRNQFCDIAVLADPVKFAARVRRDTGLAFEPRQAELV
ncbi:hypothetical protein OOT33_17100 [Sphingobium sp. DEHP117]|uniref:hypothetical protein n=1 Tax=Sphingobium sp. DEHP117 TaxID=2993436 RepID=UPI0027D58BCD|nr:hypothetical protein [Sphingobium sp. DEHP117]MDQ4422131.1 hypothetical protein [Sphingobium sp. DEHP117]